MTSDPVAAFAARYEKPATFLARAPGRVNLIGEHIDYNGLSVLPMAIPRHVVLAGRARSDTSVRIDNIEGGFGGREFILSAAIPPQPTGDWANYVQAAGQTLVQRCGPLTGIDAVVGTTLPTAAGLSSSSALVVAAAVALLHANRLTLDPVELAELMAAGERYVGTHGGGMDQAISAGASPGTACRVDFHPLRLTPVPFPPSWRVVVAHSLAAAEKSGAQQETYNRRTRECRDARIAVADALDAPDAERTYPALIARYGTAGLVEQGDRVLQGNLRRRFRHVVTEAARVFDAENALRTGDLDRFGRLLHASHASLRDDYEVSSPTLDRLCAIADGAGAAGARLTGAGMGGCAIAVCDTETVDRVMAALREQFYAPRGATADLSDRLFVAEPAGGATVTLV